MAVEELSIDLYLDHNTHRRPARDLARYGFDVAVATDVGNRDAADEAHFEWETQHGRVLLTFDAGDFRLLAQRWAEQGRDHAGTILSEAPPRVTYRQLLRRRLAFLDAVSTEEMVNQVRWLDESWSRER